MQFHQLNQSQRLRVQWLLNNLPNHLIAIDFRPIIAGIRAYFKENDFLTPKQIAILEKTHKAVTKYKRSLYSRRNSLIANLDIYYNSVGKQP